MKQGQRYQVVYGKADPRGHTDVCRGLAVHTPSSQMRSWTQWAFECQPNGVIKWGASAGKNHGHPVPKRLQEMVESHCRHNCTSPRWRPSAYARGGRGFSGGCGCGG